MRTSHSAALGLLLLAASIGCTSSLDSGSSTGGGTPYTTGGESNYGGASSGSGGWTGDGIGADPGGVQDIGYVRQVIEGGGVPQSSHLATEGLLSEHDLPINGAPCDGLFCLRPMLGVAKSLRSGLYEYWVLVGMNSGLSADFQRPPLDVVVVIDKSSSMSIDMSETTQAVASLIDKLGDNDRLGVVTFDDTARIFHHLGRVLDKEDLKSRVRAIGASNGANLQEGVRLGYDMLEPVASDETRMHRVVVLSCGYPYLSPDGDDAFSMMVHDGAERGIGLSFFGVLLGWSPDLGKLVGRERGGAYGYLSGLADVTRAFDTDFDFMVTPLAYDLALKFDVGAEFSLAQFYGFPANSDGTPSTEATIATVFPSRKSGGGVVARLNRVEGASGFEAGSITFSYDPESALGFEQPEPRAETIAFPPSLPDQGPAFYQAEGVRIAVALANQAERMQDACDAYHDGDAAAGIAILEELAEHLRAEAAELDNAGLITEAELVEKLMENMR